MHKLATIFIWYWWKSRFIRILNIYNGKELNERKNYTLK